jgi:hypothetical protein
MSWLSYALHLHHRTTRSIIVATIAFSLGSAGTALAVRGFVASDNLFHMCAANGGGVRVLEDGDSCKPGEIGFSLPSQAYVDAAMAGVSQGDANTLAAAKSYTDSSVGTEAAARQAADSALQSNLDAETAARKQGDADTLTSGKSYTDGAVAAEAAARQAADTALQSNLDSEMAARRQGDVDTLAAAKAYTDSRPAGSLSLTILSTRVSNLAQLDPGGTLTASVSCGSGRSLVGGGASSSNNNVVLYQSFPASTLLWTASARAVGTVAPFGAGLTVFAICAG